MLDKIKGYLNYLFGLIIVILGVILSNRNRKLQKVESELTKATIEKGIIENETQRQDAKHTADDLVDEYHKLRGGDK